jgi:hypothetical protein
MFLRIELENAKEKNGNKFVEPTEHWKVRVEDFVCYEIS